MKKKEHELAHMVCRHHYVPGKVTERNYRLFDTVFSALFFAVNDVRFAYGVDVDVMSFNTEVFRYISDKYSSIGFISLTNMHTTVEYTIIRKATVMESLKMAEESNSEVRKLLANHGLEQTCLGNFLMIAEREGGFSKESKENIRYFFSSNLTKLLEFVEEDSVYEAALEYVKFENNIASAALGTEVFNKALKEIRRKEKEKNKE